MNRTILILFCIVFLTFMFACNTGRGKQSELLGRTDTADIQKIIFSGKQRTELSRNEQEWLVNSRFRAHPKSLKRLMQIFSEIEIKGKLPKEQTDTVWAKLKDEGIRMQIFNDKEQISEWIIGYYSESYDATYINFSTNDSSVYLAYLPGLTKKLSPMLTDNNMYWITTYIFDYEYFEIKEVAIRYDSAPEQSFYLKIMKDTAILTDSFESEHNYPVNLSAVGRYLSYFKQVRFDSLPNPALRPKTQPEHILKLTDNTGKQTILKTYARKIPGDTLTDKHKCYATINDTTFVLVRRYELDLLLKSKAYFMK